MRDLDISLCNEIFFSGMVSLLYLKNTINIEGFFTNNMFPYYINCLSVVDGTLADAKDFDCDQRHMRLDQ